MKELSDSFELLPLHQNSPEEDLYFIYILGVLLSEIESKIFKSYIPRKQLWQLLLYYREKEMFCSIIIDITTKWNLQFRLFLRNPWLYQYGI